MHATYHMTMSMPDVNTYLYWLLRTGSASIEGIRHACVGPVGDLACLSGA